MIESKVILFFVQRQATTKVSRPHPSPQVEDNQILVVSHYNYTQQDHTPSRVSQRSFQALMFFGSTQQTHQDEPSYRPHPPPVILSEKNVI